MPLPVRADYDSSQRRALDRASTYTRRMNEQMDLIDANLDNMSDSLKQRFKHIVASQLSLIKYRNGEDAFADNLNRYKKEASKMENESKRTTATSDRTSRMTKEISSWHATHGSHEEESGYVDQYSSKAITEDGSFRAFSPEQIGSKKITDDKNTKVERNSIDTKSNRMSEQSTNTAKSYSNTTPTRGKSHDAYDPHRNSYKNRDGNKCNRPCNIDNDYVETKRNKTKEQTETQSTSCINRKTENQDTNTGELSDRIKTKTTPTRNPVREYNYSPVDNKTNMDSSNKSTSPIPPFKSSYRHDVNSAGSSYQNDLMSIRDNRKVKENHTYHSDNKNTSVTRSNRDKHTTDASLTDRDVSFDLQETVRPRSSTPVSEKYEMHTTRPRSSTPVFEKYDTHGIHSPRLSPIPTSTMVDFYLPSNSGRTPYSPIPTLTKTNPNPTQNSARPPYSPMRTSTIVDPNLSPNTTRSRYNPIPESANMRFSPIAPTVKARYQSPVRERHHSNTQESPVKRELQTLVDNLGKYNDQAEIQKNDTKEVISRIQDKTASPVHRLTLPTSRSTSVPLEQPQTFKEAEISQHTKNEHSDKVINYTSTSPDTNFVNRHNIPSSSINESADLTHDISLSRSGIQSTVLSPRLHFQSTIQYNPTINTSGSPVALKSIRHSFYCSECSESKQPDVNSKNKISKQENEQFTNSDKQQLENEDNERDALDRHATTSTGENSTQSMRRFPTVSQQVHRNHPLPDRNNGHIYPDEALQNAYANDVRPSGLRNSYANETDPGDLRYSYANSRQIDIRNQDAYETIPSDLPISYGNEADRSDFQNAYSNESDPGDLRNPNANEARTSELRYSYANESGPYALQNSYEYEARPRNSYAREVCPSDLRTPYASEARHSDLRNSYANNAESSDFRIPYANEDSFSFSQHRANNDNVTCTNTLKSRTIDSYETSPNHQSLMKHDPSQPEYTVNDDFVATSRNHNAGNSDLYGTSPQPNPPLKHLSQASKETASLVGAYANIKTKLYSSALTSLMTSLQNTVEDHIDKEFDREMWTALHGSIREISEDFQHYVSDIGSQENNNMGLEDFDHLYCLLQQLLTEGPCHERLRLKSDVDDTMWRLRSHLEDACTERRRLLPEVETILATLQNLTECFAVCGDRYFGKGSRRKMEVPEYPEASPKREESTSLSHGFLATANKIRQRLMKDHLTQNVIEKVVKLQDKETDEKFSPAGTCSPNRSYNQQGRSLPKLLQRTNSPCYHDDDLAECDECSNDTISENDTFTEFQSAQTSFNDEFFTQARSDRMPSPSRHQHSNNVGQFVQTPSTRQPSPCRNDYDEYLVKPIQIRQPSPQRKCQFQKQCVPSLSQYRKNEFRDKAVFALLVFGIVKFLGHFGPGFLQIVYDLCIGILMFINCNIKLEQFDPHIT